MKIDIAPEVIQYYEKYYDVIRIPDFHDDTRLLKPKHGITYLGNKKVCRFCGKSAPDVKFKKTAHAFPESIGNHALAIYYECDDCNSFFGRTLENDYNVFFNLFHCIMQIDGKRGKQKCNFKIPCSKREDDCANHCIEIGLDNGKPVIRKCREVEEKYVSLTSESIVISKPVGSCCPISVFKAIVKMALTVLPPEELSLFSETLKWIREEEPRNFYRSRRLIVRCQMIPGFNVTKYPHFILYKRKSDVWDKPYLLSHLTYGCFSLLIEVPRNSDNGNDAAFENVMFPPLPFYTSSEGKWDLSDIQIQPGFKQSICLSFEKAVECTEEMKQRYSK